MKLFKKHDSDDLAATIANLRQVIAGWETKIAKLQESEHAGRQQIAALESERKEWVLAAVADGDPSAQAQLQRLDGEQDRTARSQRDYEVALAQANSKLEFLRQQLAVAEKQMQVDLLRGLVPARLARGKRIAALVEQLGSQLRQASAEEAEIKSGLLRLDPNRLGNLAEWASEKPRSYAWAFLKHSLRDVLPVASGSHHSPAELASLDALDERFFGGILDALKALPLAGSTPDAGECLYEAAGTIHGLKGHSLSPGEVIRLQPEEAAEMLNAGVLRECGA
jgi:hypothetical protein